MAKAFLIDLSHCNGCYNCQLVCKDEHCETDWLPYSAAQPLTGQFWLRIDEKVRGQVPWVRVSYVPTLCAHCADAPCMAAAAALGKPEAVYRRDDGLVIFDPAFAGDSELANALVKSCPLGAVYLNESSCLAQKCTGCAHLLDNGWTVPRCVDACPHDAIQFKDKAEFGALLSKAEVLPAVASLGPKVYYLNLPKRFVAGSVVDFAADEVLIGAKVELVSVADSSSSSFGAARETDDLGDFKFDQIPADEYQVTVTAEGYAPLVVRVDLRDEDNSLGDLSIEKQGSD